jgi:hypothetical protein
MRNTMHVRLILLELVILIVAGEAPHYALFSTLSLLPLYWIQHILNTMFFPYHERPRFTPV